MKLMNDYRKFKSKDNRLTDLENFFGKNIALLKMKKNRQVLKYKYVEFTRKPQFWENLIFLSEEKDVYYFRITLHEILPYLALSTTDVGSNHFSWLSNVD